MPDSPQVHLRPVAESDLGLLETVQTLQTDPWNFFGYRYRGQVRQDYAANGLLGDDRGQLIVEVGGQPVGDVSWHAVRYGPPRIAASFNIGISLLTDHRGKGYGTSAQRQLAEYLFATYAINRVEAGTDIANLAEQRSLGKAGFTREGVLRGSQFRAGEWHDMVMFSRLRAD